MIAARRAWPEISLLAVLVLVVGVVAGVLVETGPAAAVPDPRRGGSGAPVQRAAVVAGARPGRVSCTHGNPGGDGYHPYWALDLLADCGDPILAAGAGIFHIGSLDRSCRSSAAEAAGTWVWSDHGGGVVTKYTHLDSVLVADGQLLTPATQIGTMGSSGDVLPCTTNYLHFEVRTGGITGPPVDPGQPGGCSGSTRVAYPRAWGYSSSRDVPKVQRTAPVLGDACLPGSTQTTTAASAVGARVGDGTVRVAWSKPTSGAATVDSYVVSVELWGPSIAAWHPATYRTVPAGQFATNFRGLDNGRRYRFTVLAHNGVGNSNWAAPVERVPATAPLAPGTGRQLSTGKSYVRFGWWNGTTRGAPITSYAAGIRSRKPSGWTAWSFVTVPAGVRTYRWDGLAPGATYQVTVRANSDAGSSPWGTFRAVTTAAS